jgi:hypothetical protein
LDEFEINIRKDETLADRLLESLIRRAEPMALNRRIDNLTKRIEKLEEGS